MGNEPSSIPPPVEVPQPPQLCADYLNTQQREIHCQISQKAAYTVERSAATAAIAVDGGCQQTPLLGISSIRHIAVLFGLSATHS